MDRRLKDAETPLKELKDRIQRFTDERDWHQFHDLKNLSMALAIEAGELMEHFRWVANTEAQSVMKNPGSAVEIREELADVLLFVVQFANVANIDLMEAAERKLAINAERYPISKSKGVATKYNKL
ncbi:MAG: nucleotide pyrophosphohydrolase [Planctomycetota bacterium]